MFDLNQHDDARPRCLFTSLELPSGVKLEQPPTKKKPFSSIHKHTFTHTLEVLLPRAATQAFRDVLKNESATLHYAKVHMKLRDVIQGDFFNQYIKSGNISMLSSGRSGIDHLFYLIDGVLHLEVDKPTFERLGINGKPMAHCGRKHVKARYLIELNLRLPSMVRGKSGFERIVWAFDNVLDQAISWLFCDLNRPTDGTGPIAIHQPFVRHIQPNFEDLGGVIVPAFPLEMRDEDAPEASELLEWLSLTLCNSPRVRLGDQIEPALSRYQVPHWLGHEDDGMQTSVQDLVKVQWKGLITGDFVLKIFLVALRVSHSRWMAINATQFNGEAYTILFTENKFLTWECED